VCGVPAEHLHIEDQMHGFLLLSKMVAKAASLVDRTAEALSSHGTATRRAQASLDRGPPLERGDHERFSLHISAFEQSPNGSKSHSMWTDDVLERPQERHLA
jgi:hypothetical protein